MGGAFFTLGLVGQFTKNMVGGKGFIALAALIFGRWNPIGALLASLFQWGVALHDLDIESIRKMEKDPEVMKKQLKQIGVKVRRQVGKDYVLFPLLTGPAAIQTATMAR